MRKLLLEAGLLAALTWTATNDNQLPEFPNEQTAPEEDLIPEDMLPPPGFPGPDFEEEPNPAEPLETRVPSEGAEVGDPKEPHFGTETKPPAEEREL